MRRQAVLLAGLLGLLLAASALAITPFGRGAKAKANVDAAKELAALQLPHGASQVHGDQSVKGVLGPPVVACTRKHVVYDFGFWRVTGKPSAVWAWVRNHPPPHVRWIAWAESEPVSSVDFGFADQRNVISRILKVTVAAAKGSGSAVRADGVAVWLPRGESSPCVQSY